MAMINPNPNKLVKILNKDRTHNGLTYVLGRNECPQPFNRRECADGGLYACRLKDLFHWFYLYKDVDTVAVVEIPEDAQREEFATKVKASALVITDFLPILDVMEIAVCNGASVKANCDSTLYWAASNGNLPVVQFLVHHGAYNMEKALLIAVEKGHYEVARFLLEKGADANAEDCDDHPAITTSIVNGDMRMVELLIKHGADVNHIDDPLSIAAHQGDLSMVELLVKRGAEPNGHVFYLAGRSEHNHIVEYLKSLP